MQALRDLPSVDQVLRKLPSTSGWPDELVVRQIRAVLAERREALKSGAESAGSSVEQEVAERLQALLQPSLRRVINASGVILHTNLGRAPLPYFEPISGYSNLEYDLHSGKRGKRDAHTAALLEQLIGKPSILVNNNAAAVYLVLNELAAGNEAIVSRGELIEIGDGFRIPDIMARSGAILREVGTTNRTSLDDYRQAINDRTRVILRVHPSNFHITGFTTRPGLQELAALGRDRGIPVYEDLGSGCLVDLSAQGIKEPLVADSIAAGVSVLSFSCDKLLGGPQSGIISGDPDLIARIRRNAMYRTFRVDKLIVQAMQTILLHLLRKEQDAIPALRMIFTDSDKVRQRAERAAALLTGLKPQLRKDESPIGGGSTPDQTLPTWVIEFDAPDPLAFERALRIGDVPVIARIERDRVILDMRTVADDEVELLVRAAQAAFARH